jgi:hypothetical protein
MLFCCSCLLFVVSLQCYSKCDSVTVSSFICGSLKIWCMTYVVGMFVYKTCLACSTCCLLGAAFNYLCMLRIRLETGSLKIRYIPRCFVLLLDFFSWFFEFPNFNMLWLVNLLVVNAPKVTCVGREANFHVPGLAYIFLCILPTSS